jgi:hypothetical protein
MNPRILTDWDDDPELALLNCYGWNWEVPPAQCDRGPCGDDPECDCVKPTSTDVAD